MQKNVHALLIGSIDFDLVSRPIGLFRLRTAANDAGFNAEVIDYSWCLDEEELLKVCSHCIGPDTLLFGISGVWWSLLEASHIKKHTWASENFFKKFKNLYPHVKIVLGAPEFALNINEDVQQNTDWIVRGFSDDSFPELLKKLAGKANTLKYIKQDGKYIVNSNRDHIVKDLSTLQTIWKPQDGWLPNQPVPLELSRGCIFKCSFCNHPFLGKKVDEYIRSAASIAEELKRNYELFGSTRYNILDDTMNDSMAKLDRLEEAIEISKIPSFEFCAYIKPETIATNFNMITKLKTLGLKGGFVGIESFNMPARKAVGKGMDVNRVNDACRKLVSETGAKLFCSLILGLPGDKVDDADAWMEFLQSTKDELYSCWNMHPLGIMGTPGEEGNSMIGSDPAKYGYVLTGYNKTKNLWSWRNKNMSSMEAYVKSEEFRKKSGPLKPGGWFVASAWYCNKNLEEPFTLGELARLTAPISIARKNNMLQSLQ